MKIWYYISNGGDGSASARFFKDEEAADLMEEIQYEGWAEPSVACLEVDKDVEVLDKYFNTVDRWHFEEQSEDWQQRALKSSLIIIN